MGVLVRGCGALVLCVPSAPEAGLGSPKLRPLGDYGSVPCGLQLQSDPDAPLPALLGARSCVAGLPATLLAPYWAQVVLPSSGGYQGVVSTPLPWGHLLCRPIMLWLRGGVYCPVARLPGGGGGLG